LRKWPGVKVVIHELLTIKVEVLNEEKECKPAEEMTVKAL